MFNFDSNSKHVIFHGKTYQIISIKYLQRDSEFTPGQKFDPYII